MRALAERYWALDIRSLTLFRILLALIILGDLAIRATDLAAFYTDDGVLPRWAHLPNFADPWYVSLHMMGGTLAFESALFLVAALFAVMMLVGFRTRFATVASWLLLISLHSRNRMVIQGGDDLLRALMFWAMFLPLGASYSVDSSLDTSTNGSQRKQIFSVATFALLAQMVMMYWFAVAYKSGAEWRVEGSALYYALSIEQMSTGVGRLLLHAPVIVLRFLTFFVVASEALVPLLLIFSSGPFRASAVLLIIALHLGMATCIQLGPFPWVATAGVAAFLPEWFWEGMLKSISTPQSKKLTIYYDDTCDFCKKTVFILRTFFLVPDTQVLPAQQTPGMREEMDDYRSWIVVDHTGKHWHHFEALAVVFSYSPLLWPFARWMRWRPVFNLGDKMYEWVASHRPLLSRSVSHFRFRPNRMRLGRAGSVFVAAMICYVFLWNLTPFSSQFGLPDSLRFAGPLLRLDQGWDMFSPFPLKDDGWYVMLGKLRDGREVNVLPRAENLPVAWEKPKDIAEMYPNERWRKYLMNFYFAHNAAYRPYFGQYICRKWNRGKTPADNDALISFQIYFNKKITQPNFEPPVMSRELLLNQVCSR